MRHIFIVNPAAGKESAYDRVVREAARVLGEGRGEYEIVLTRYPGHASELALQYAQDGGDIRIYACGGDGTLNEVINGAVGSENCAVTSYPTGTGNDFVKYYGEGGKDAFLDLEALVNGEIKTVDVIECDGMVGLNTVAAGFDAKIAANMGIFRNWPCIGGAAAYNLSVVYTFFTKIKYRMAGYCDDHPAIPEDDYIFIVAGNGRFYGGGYLPTPYADISDGLIDVLSVRALPRARLLGLISKYRAGEVIEMPEIAGFHRCKELRIESPEPVTIAVDGEIRTVRNPVIKLLPAAVKLIVPRGQSEVILPPGMAPEARRRPGVPV